MAFSVSIDSSWFTQAPIQRGEFSSPSSERNGNVRVQVFPDWYKAVSLEWNIPSDWGNCQFHVYFWPGGDAGYQRLTTTPISNPYFKDPTSKEYSKFHNGYYVVEVLILSTNQRVRSSPVSWHYKRRERVERIATEIQRREYMLLSKFTGAKSFLFRKRLYGLRCSRCWSVSTEKVMDDHCPVCYGTSFQGGYFDPVPIFVQYDPTPNQKVKSYFGDAEPNSIQSWTISIPEISPGDILIRSGDWNVYNVTRIANTELQTNTVRQMMALTQLSKGDIENQLAFRIQADDASTYLSDMPTVFAGERFPQNLIDKKPENDYPWAQDQDLQQVPKYKV